MLPPVDHLSPQTEHLKLQQTRMSYQLKYSELHIPPPSGPFQVITVALSQRAVASF